MAHFIQAIVTRNRVAEAICTHHPELLRVNARVGFSILPVEGEFVNSVARPGPTLGTDDEFWVLTEGFCEFLQQLSGLGPIAYVETEYHGGVGGQGAAVYTDGQEIVAPSWSEHGAINTALAKIGVTRSRGADEFATVGLPAYRSNEELRNAALRHIQSDVSAQTASPMPVNRLQMWLARGAIVVCLLLLIAFRGFDSEVVFGEIQVTKSGDATIYLGSSRGVMLFGVMGILTCVLGIVYAMQPGRVFRFFSFIFFVITLLIAVAAPSLLFHQVVVEPNSFSRRVGSWYSPEVVQIDFESVIAMDVVQIDTKSEGQRKQFALRVLTEPTAEFVDVPVHAMMREALPEILDRATTHGVQVFAGARERARDAEQRD